MELTKNHILEGVVTRKFAALIHSDTSAVFMAVLGQKLLNNGNWGVFRGRKENPYISGGFINHNEVQGVAIVRKDDAVS
jgi:hypothetical protein